jgi:hypothetical protein
LLRATGLATATDALVRVKSHYPDVDMAKIKGGADTTRTSKPWSLRLKRPPMK